MGHIKPCMFVVMWMLIPVSQVSEVRWIPLVIGPKLWLPRPHLSLHEQPCSEYQPTCIIIYVTFILYSSLIHKLLWC